MLMWTTVRCVPCLQDCKRHSVFKRAQLQETSDVAPHMVFQAPIPYHSIALSAQLALVQVVGSHENDKTLTTGIFRCVDSVHARSSRRMGTM